MIKLVNLRLFAALAVASTVGILASADQPAVSVWQPKLERTSSPAGPNSAQPQLSSSDRGLLLSWIERDGPKATLRFSERGASGWSAARDAASGTDWFVNWADVPSVIRLASGELAAHWLQKSGPDTYAYDVRLAYSKDDGKTWSSSFTPHSDGTKTEHGFASLLQMPGAGLGLAWLDGRAMKSGGSHDAHGGADAGAMSVRFGTFGRNWKQISEEAVDLRVCECCPTTAALTSDGPIVAYRNRTEDEIRDIYVSRLEKGKWTEAKPVHADGWKIPACPVNGPMLSARGRNVVLAWFTAAGGDGRTMVAFSKDAGRTFTAPARVDDTGSLGRVDAELLADGSALVSWIETTNKRTEFRARRIEPNGTRSAPLTISELAGSRASGYPRMGTFGDQLVFAWTDTANGLSQVQTAVTRLPSR